GQPDRAGIAPRRDDDVLARHAAVGDPLPVERGERAQSLKREVDERAPIGLSQRLAVERLEDDVERARARPGESQLARGEDPLDARDVERREPLEVREDAGSLARPVEDAEDAAGAPLLQVLDEEPPLIEGL